MHEATCATSWGAVRAELTRVMVRIECSAIGFPGAALGTGDSGPRCPWLGCRACGARTNRLTSVVGTWYLVRTSRLLMSSSDFLSFGQPIVHVILLVTFPVTFPITFPVTLPMTNTAAFGTRRDRYCEDSVKAMIKL